MAGTLPSRNPLLIGSRFLLRLRYTGAAVQKQIAAH